MKHPALEPLESRIAPAVFFVSGVDLKVYKSPGVEATPTTDETDAATNAFATRAVLLATGDSLVFDLNGNGKLDKKTDFTMIKVDAGKAMAFLTDGDNSGVGRFSADELTGIAAGDGLVATIKGSVNGSIDTLLDINGKFTADKRQLASIAGLTITGIVRGNIQAGKDISNVTFIVPKGAPASVFDLSGDIRTGTAADIVNLGNDFVLPDSSLIVGDGGNISGIKLPRGVGSIVAGDGDSSDPANPGKGGSISNVTINAQTLSAIRAGNGGDGDSGGVAGEISNLTVNVTNALSPMSIDIYAGRGGHGTSGIGATGGAITTTKLSVVGGAEHEITVNAGAGGNGGSASAGGVGGAINDFTYSAGNSQALLRLLGGDGGSGGSSALGGNGGAVSNVKLTGNYYRGIYIKAGEGGIAGSGSRAGSGGAVENISVSFKAILGDISIYGGKGGYADSLGTTAASGNGGEVKNVILKGNYLNSVEILGGNGGTYSDSAVLSNTLKMGNGGAVSFVNIAVATVNSYFNISGGDGTSPANDDGTDYIAGDGGNLSDVTVKITGAVSDTNLLLGGGIGGSMQGSTAGDGAKGGDISNITLTVKDIYRGHGLSVTGGRGGQGPDSADGNGGAGGSLSNVSLTLLGDISDQVYVSGGFGGNSGSNSIVDDGAHSGVGGAGGSASQITLINKGTVQNGLVICGGFAGDQDDDKNTVGEAYGTGGNLNGLTITNPGKIYSVLTIAGGNGAYSKLSSAGNGGSLSNVKITDSGNELAWTLRGGIGGSSEMGDAGDTGSAYNITFLGSKSSLILGSTDSVSTNGANKFGGTGGSISTIRGTAANLMIVAPNGGDSLGTNGVGGSGGSVDDVIFSVGNFARIIAAGNGGNVDTGGTPGSGGSVTDVRITGTIGDFNSAYGTYGLNVSGMGGLVAGQGGMLDGDVDLSKNGSISNVTAGRISAVLAGSNNLGAASVANAVKSIANLQASLIGADFKTGNGFDYIGSDYVAGFSLEAGDTPIDGLIIVLQNYTNAAATKIVIPVP